MQANILMDFLVLEKKLYGKLTEVTELTRQLAEAVDRQDPVSVRLLISMRQEPIYSLQEIQANLELSQIGLADAARIGALLEGEDAATEEEQPLADQVATNRHLLERLLTLDRQVSLKLGGEDSAYQRRQKKGI
ncbi:MAG: hypothetical protein RR295_09550 [Oscillospiraceae bacterium]